MPTRPRWLPTFVQIIALVFPAFAVSVPDGGSVAYLLLALFGLFLGWPAWRELAPAEKRFLLGITAYFLVILLTLIHTQDFDTASRKLDRFLRILLLVPGYLLLRRSGADTGRAFLYGAVVAGFTLAFHGWYQVKVEGIPYAAGIYHKIVFGDMAVLVAGVLAAAMVTLARRPWHYALLSLSVLAALYASLLSMTRSSWLLVPVAVFGLLWLYRKALGRRGWLAVAGVMVLVIAVGTIWTPTKLKQGIDRGIENLKVYERNPDAGTSWGIRLNLWHDSLLLFAEHPLLGTGVGDFDVERNRLIAEGRANPLPSFGHAHSIYFHSLATTGLVGFIAMLVCLIWLPLRAAYGMWLAATTPWAHFHALGGLLTVVGFAVFGVAETWFARMPFATMYGMFLIVFLSSAMNATRPPTQNAAQKPAQ